MVNKKAYFQGGGGVNEPTPGEKKYKSDPAIVVQPRFEEPFYRNYDLYTIPGMENVGPGTGWHGLQSYKNVQDFLEDRRKRLQPRYVADDSWQLDNGERTKKNPIKTRAAIFEKIIKMAGPNYDLGKGLYSNLDKYDSVEEFREDGPHGPGAIMDVNHIDFPLDDQIGSDPIIGDSGSSYMDSIPISYEEGYTPLPDTDNKPESTLDFGRDLTDEATPGRSTDKTIDLDKLMTKYLAPAEVGIMGLPDGVDPEGHDADQTEQIEQPYTGTSDIGTNIYDDKWNI
jgi:hypothetical protein